MTENKNLTLVDDKKLTLEMKTFQMVGVDDYNALLNRPKINGVDVSGEKMLDDYDIKQKSEANAEHTEIKSAISAETARAENAEKANTDAITDHIADKNNPHGVTKTQVGLGNVANYDQSKAIKSITRSGTTFTATALDGTIFTFTQQDNNTTYGVATQNENGLMSSDDKTKLDSLNATSVSAITNSEIDSIVAR